MIAMFQIVAGFAWLSVIVARIADLLRVIFRGTDELADFYSSLLVGVGAVQLGFAVRWVLYPAVESELAPGELVLWASLYFTSTVIAIASHAVPRRG